MRILCPSAHNASPCLSRLVLPGPPPNKAVDVAASLDLNTIAESAEVKAVVDTAIETFSTSDEFGTAVDLLVEGSVGDKIDTHLNRKSTSSVCVLHLRSMYFIGYTSNICCTC